MLRLPRIAASRALLVAYVLLLSTIICSHFLFTEARISGFSVIQGAKVIKVIICYFSPLIYSKSSSASERKAKTSSNLFSRNKSTTWTSWMKYYEKRRRSGTGLGWGERRKKKTRPVFN
ncbi:hypothetical protein NC651_028120 [Populus alba x Populus x berolinensis]|nr:hypothetical protein NC651_028120 [Populus alba x Populus x berolinensis]